ncbi:hypothetical protein Glove_26g164 [Diversispora epigaea]|uniref:Uncharacterized protein n=1 Tax=Diversispora epigaea TaxID=1348612 RepID=A0A397JJC3_9GLOM|nr:hypothetical protein Glove_26g164 [Diversispora epigaea]
MAVIPAILKERMLSSIGERLVLDDIWKAEVIREIRKRLIVDCTFILGKTTVKALIDPKSYFSNISKELAKKLDCYISRDFGGSGYPAVKELGIGAINSVLDKPEYELVLGDIWIGRLMDRIREHIHPKPKLYMYTPEWYNARNNKEEKPIISLKKFYNLLFPDCTFDFQVPDN